MRIMRCEGAITKSERFFVWEQGVPQSIHLTERTAAQQMSAAAASGDTAKVQTIIKQNSGLHGQGQKLAKKIGASECAK